MAFSQDDTLPAIPVNGHKNGHNGREANGPNKPSLNGSPDEKNFASMETMSAASYNVPIAICGMGMRLPGGIRNDRDLYSFLVGKRDARMPIPKERYNIDAYYNEHHKLGSISTHHGYFLEDLDLSKFDVSMFSMTAAEVNRLDPNQRLILEVVREAFESAGESEFRGKNIATYASVYSEDWQDMQNRDLVDIGPYQLTGKLDFMLSNRIAYEYDLRGPSSTVKTACSSSGMALHQALQSIRLGETSSAIVAGANLLMTPSLTVTMSGAQILSPDGSCKSFDAAANGFARAEAVSCLYVKRLDRAIRDGNPVRAVIRASAAGADGKTGGVAVPNPAAHEALIRATYRSAGLDFARTAMFECHGTGTAVGDPMECIAIANCFGHDGIYIGSVKPNLGHSEGASAISSLLKATLALENKTIIPNIKFNTPNPAIPWDEAKLKVATDPEAWPKDRAERISVNSFGFGGSNVHFILESAKSYGISPNSLLHNGASQHRAKNNLLLFSANSTQSLHHVADSHLRYLELYPERLESLAYNLAERREHLTTRAFCITDGTTPGKVSSHAKRAHGTSKVAFVFTGQGAQWPRMGRHLLDAFPLFRATIRELDSILQSLQHAPDWSIEETLLACEDKAIIARPDFSQPLCTALQIALVDLLASWNVLPACVVGHSSGEIAAAYAAGALSKRSAIITAYYRGYCCVQYEKSQSGGGMAAVGMGVGDVHPFLVDGVGVACENSNKSVTLSGDIKALEITLAAIKMSNPDIFTRRLQVETAYHSPRMQAIGDRYRELISGCIEQQDFRIPFFSSVKAKLLKSGSDVNAEYWQENLEHPVLFHSAATALLQDHPEIGIHLEIGPHGALAGPLRQIYTERNTSSMVYVPTLVRNKNDSEAILESIGQLFCAGVEVRPPVSPESRRVLTDLPSYPWHYDQSYWADNRIMFNYRHQRYAAHDILGTRLLEASDLEPCWRKLLRVADVPWIQDHRVGSDIVFPAAGYVAMAGEAIKQMQDGDQDPIDGGYTVRDVSLSHAMLFRDDDTPLEVLTSLRQKALTTRLDSNWYEFSISSHNSSGWTKHCRGLVTIGHTGSSGAPQEESIKTFTKKVSTDRWYKAMAHVGLNYGPRFTGLQDITAAVRENAASACVTDRREAWESSYNIHPSTLDIMFQSLIVAQTRGVYRDLNKLALPTLIEELYVGAVDPSTTIKLVTEGASGSNKMHGSSYGVVGGHRVLSLKGLHGTPVENESPTQEMEANTQHLHWKPDFDLIEHPSLMRRVELDPEKTLVPVERLFVLCAIEAQQKLQGAIPCQPHYAKFMGWLDKQIKRFAEGNIPLVPDSDDLLRLSSDSRQQIMRDCLEKTLSLKSRPLGLSTWKTFENIRDIIEGRVEFLDLLYEDGLLQSIYDWMNDRLDNTAFFQLLGNTQPQIRILEIGAGTGGLTSKILNSLRSEYGERLFLSYTYTDVSSGFFVQAQDRFKDYDGIEYKVLDISKDPIEQGFDANGYNLVVASNVLHATPILRETLSNCRKLLKPDGRLFLQELSPVTRGVNFVFGLFSGWWLGKEDDRPDEPYISPSEWDERLRDVGFQGVDSVTFDGDEPYQLNANIIARPAISEPVSATPEARRVTLLTNSKPMGPFATFTRDKFESQGYEVDHCIWSKDMVIPEGQDLISFLDVEDSRHPILRYLSQDTLDQLLGLVESMSGSTILWLTRSAQLGCEDPHHGQILGFARTARMELAVDFATLELDSTSIDAASAVPGVLGKIQQSLTLDADLDPDMEFSLKDGVVHLSRYHWVPVRKALAESQPPSDAKRLVIGQPGMLQSLEWRAQAFGDLGSDAVRMRMSTIGMNFKELMVALGVLVLDNPGEPSGGINALGAEGTGRITAVGSAVKDFKVGDRVMAIGSTSPGFATEVQRPSACCVKIPDRLSDEEAATMPAVYYTVIYCLVNRAHVERGQSLLIHSAAGGVGIAAIHVARWLGLEIYVTTGTDEKVEFLRREFGIPAERIFNSRDSSFVSGLLNVTAGRGVDFVLNSLSGELLHASWKCVAPNGTMIEIGNRDILGQGQLSMFPFHENRTFTCFDLSTIGWQVDTTRRMLKQIMDLYEDGHIHPIRPITTFAAESVEEAYRCFQRGQHIGKLVIKFPSAVDGETPALPLAPSIPAPYFRNNVSYLLVGGTGGLGKAIASWMVSCNARSLIFVSRSAGKSREDQEFFEELEEAGCHVQSYAGDVTSPATLQEVVAKSRFSIAGCMQMAMVLRDIGTMDMDIETWHTAVHPKVAGTWNLHRLLPKDMDFFVLFSSLAGTFGYFGQANYASANTFLDAFTQYRHQNGLAASVIDIGPVDDVGYVATTASTRQTPVGGMNLISEQDFLNVLQLAVAPMQVSAMQRYNSTYHNPTQYAQIPWCTQSITDPLNNAVWKRDPRMAIYRNIEKAMSASSDKGGASDVARRLISSLTAEPDKLNDPASADTLSRAIAMRVNTFLMKSDDSSEELDTSQNLAAVGVDSLVAIELRNWWKQTFGVDVSVLELMNASSIRALGDLSVERLKVRYVKR